MTPCRLSSRTRDANGYALMRIGGSLERAHRVAWQRRHGTLEPHEILINLCGRRHCVNPDHWTPHPRRGPRSLTQVRQHEIL